MSYVNEPKIDRDETDDAESNLEKPAMYLPELTDEQKADFIKKFPGIQRDCSKVKAQWQLLKQNYPEHFDELSKKYPQYAPSLSETETIMDQLNSRAAQLNNDQLADYINRYNFHAHKLMD